MSNIAAEIFELYARYIQGLKRTSEKERDEILKLLDEYKLEEKEGAS